MVEGTPPGPPGVVRPSAVRSASAQALNAASIRWWSLVPRITSTWSASPAVWAKEWKKWGTISHDRSPTLSLAKPHLAGEERTPGHVDDGASQGLVEGRISRAEAHDPGPVAQRLVHGLAEHQAHVLHRVVVVHLKVAGARQLQVPPGVEGQGVQHVVEEPDPGVEAGRPGTGPASTSH